MHIGIRVSRLAAVLSSVTALQVASRPAVAQDQPAPPQQPAESAPKLPDAQLDSLVAPIALYPDPLLAQVLAASTYPLEIVQLQQWLGQHADLKDQALADAVQQQNWDPSVQALAPLPDVVKLLASDIQWTTDLGNAFLAQESDVMEAVQRMRAKAKANGNLKSNDKMKVETKTVEKETVVVIEQADPQVVYVPAYNPAVVYGPAPYPYPPVTYPTGAYVAGAVISFGVGIALGAAFHGGWGYHCGWGGAHGNVVTINNNNTFVRNSAARTGGRYGAGPRGEWQHNPQHRGGAPYADRATAGRYGGSTAREGARAQRVESAGARPERGGERVGDRNVAPSAGGGRAREGEALGGGARGSYDGRNARSSSERGASSLGERGGRGGAERGGGGGGRGGGGRGGGRR